MSPRIGIALSAVCMAVAAQPVAAQTAVVTSVSGPISRTYPRGTQVDHGRTFELRRGDSITLLTSDGSRLFVGPGLYRFDLNDRQRRPRYSGRAQERAAVTRVVAVIEDSQPPPPSQTVPADVDGRYCRFNDLDRDDYAVELPPDFEGGFAIYEPGGLERLAVLQFDARGYADWPAELWIFDRNFEIRRSGDESGATVTFIDLGTIADDTDPEEFDTIIDEAECSVRLFRSGGSLD